jgi:hypothetical protein
MQSSRVHRRDCIRWSRNVSGDSLRRFPITRCDKRHGLWQNAFAPRTGIDGVAGDIDRRGEGRLNGLSGTKRIAEAQVIRPLPPAHRSVENRL